jgi:hypothetical protein
MKHSDWLNLLIFKSYALQAPFYLRDDIMMMSLKIHYYEPSAMKYSCDKQQWYLNSFLLHLKL